MDGRTTKLLLVIATISITTYAQTVRPVSPDNVVVIKHVTIIDATGAPPKSDMTVVIKADRIAQISNGNAVRLPSKAKVMDARGKFLIPGLWDMHVHAVSNEGRDLRFPLFVANGVTGVRDMGRDKSFPLDRMNQIRDEVRQGRVVGPRIFLAGHILEGPKPIFPFTLSLATERSAREAVDRMADGGSDFVKVYTTLTRNQFYAIANEAKRRGLPFAGHVPASVTALEASEAGQKSFEHLFGAADSCSSTGSELRQEWLEEYAKMGGSVSKVLRSLFVYQQKVLETYSTKNAEAAFDVFRRNSTWQCPTLVVWRQIASFEDPGLKKDPLLRFVPGSWKQWNEDSMLSDFSAQDFANERRALEKRIILVGAMHRAGIRFLAGTDTPFPSVYPGFSLHEELELLVKAGMTPLEALQSATLNPAEFLNLQATLGTVETGKIADLVLLRANPLTNIRNTRSIEAVVANGRLLDRQALDDLLTQAESAAKRMTAAN